MAANRLTRHPHRQTKQFQFEGALLQAQSRAIASHLAFDQPGRSIETAISSHNHQHSVAGLVTQQQAKKYCAHQFSQQSVQPAYRAACPSSDWTAFSDSSDVGRSAESDGMGAEPFMLIRPGSEANAAPVNSLRWGLHSARSSLGPKSARRHAWGSSFLCQAAVTPYSNKGFARLPKPIKATTSPPDLDVVVGTLSHKKGVVEAEQLSAVPQPNSLTGLSQCSADQSPAVPGIEPAAAARAPDGPQGSSPQPIDHPHAATSEPSLHECFDGLAPAAVMTSVAQQKGLPDAAKQGFWQELKEVLSQLPEPPRASLDPVVQAVCGAAAASANAQVKADCLINASWTAIIDVTVNAGSSARSFFACFT